MSSYLDPEESIVSLGAWDFLFAKEALPGLAESGAGSTVEKAGVGIDFERKEKGE